MKAIKILLILFFLLNVGCHNNNLENRIEEIIARYTERPPILNDLLIISFNENSITLANPTLSDIGFPDPKIEVYIGLNNTISESNGQVSNSLYDPFEIKSDYTFTNLTVNTNYKIIVIAKNTEGYSIKTISQETQTIAPVLNNLSITETNINYLILTKPTLSIVGNPTPTINAYIGIDGNISITGNTVNNSIQGPVDVSTNDRFFGSLTGNTSYKIIVIAENSKGYSVKEIVQVTQNDTLSNNLSAYYAFNNNFNDSSSNNYNATCTNCPTLTSDRFSQNNQAYNFLATQSFDINSSPNLNILSDLTINAWIFPTSTGSYQDIFTREEPGKGTYRFLIRGSYLCLDQGTTLAQSSTNSSVINLNQWNMVTVIRDDNGTALNSISFYVNGTFINSTELSQAPESVSNNKSYIGDGYHNNDSILGKIDDIRVYNRILSASEIKALYHENSWNP